MVFRLFSLVLFQLFVLQIFAQTETDLFRYSKTNYQGTARFEAMSGAFGALGADLSSSQINPAGFGRFSSDQAGVSFFGGRTFNNVVFNSSETRTNDYQGGISSAAIVLTEDISEGSNGFLFRQLGFGFNRIESFNNSFRYTGQQYESLLDNFVNQAQGYLPEELDEYFPFSTNLAYTTHAVEYNFATESYYSLLNNGDMIHDRTIEQKGGINEFFLSYSTNYLNKLYLGANLGIRTFRYLENFNHIETLTDTTNTPLRSFAYDYNLKTIGNGINFKIGAIYLISEKYRMGLALHTPTFSELTDNWSATMTSTFDDSIVRFPGTEIPHGNYKYRIRNPFKMVGSFAMVFGTRGCLNLDLELLNYKQAHFRSTKDHSYVTYDYDYENNVADQVFKTALNARIGAEFVIFNGFFLRSGLAYYGNAFKEDQFSEIGNDLTFSGGFGFKKSKISVDLAYKQRMFKRNYYAFYNSSALVNSSIGKITLSCLFNF